MELTLQETEARLPEIVTAAENGERVEITRDVEPAVQLVCCKRKQRGGLDWDRMNANGRRLRVKDDPRKEWKR